MKVGIIARGELARGLGIQSWEAARHLDPAKVLVVDVGDHERFPVNAKAFPHATVVKLTPAGLLPEDECRRWLRGLDVVLSFETFYDWQFCTWARDAGARTVVQANPEFYRHGQHPQLEHPDGWWNPTTWRMQHLPAGTVHVPVPVALERFATRKPEVGSASSRPRVLHTVGKWAMYDRNGTETFVRACYLAQHLDATVRTQEPLPEDVRPGGDWVRVEVGSAGDYWRAYDGYDVLVLPRRYGGLCLPAQEAMAAGLAVVMPAVSPNVECWPVVPIPARSSGRVPLPAGWVELAEVDAGALAATLVHLTEDPAYLASTRLRSREWAEQHSWDRLRPIYLEQLARVISHPLGKPAARPDQSHNPFAPSA